MSYGRRERAFICPTELCAGQQHAVVDSCYLRPVGHRLRFAVQSQQVATASISGLLRRGGPSSIPWLVTAIVVDAIKRVLRARRDTHVGIEVLKGLPPFTDGDPSSTVAVITRSSSSLTPCLHLGPDAIDSRPRHPMRCQRCGRATPSSFTRYFTPEAPATAAEPTTEVRSSNRPLVTAGAPTKPPSNVIPSILLRDHNEPPEPLAGEIDGISRPSSFVSNGAVTTFLGAEVRLRRGGLTQPDGDCLPATTAGYGDLRHGYLKSSSRKVYHKHAGMLRAVVTNGEAD
jgi:hypothetical protein